jgi:micrococcal nuclease
MTFLIILKIWVYFHINPLVSSVVGVMDGDTIELRIVSNHPSAKKRIGKNLRIRLSHIDCPERGQAFYTQSKMFTSQLCFKKVVKIIHKNEFDRYGRLIGEVVLPNGKILNEELVKAGLATHFKKYSSSIGYAKLEMEAKKRKIGMWSIK